MTFYSNATNYTHLSSSSAVLQTNVFKGFFHFFPCSSNSWQVIYWELIHLSNIKAPSVCRKSIDFRTTRDSLSDIVILKVRHVADTLIQYQFCLLVIITVPFKTPLLGTNIFVFSANMLNRQASGNFALISHNSSLTMKPFCFTVYKTLRLSRRCQC